MTKAELYQSLSRDYAAVIEGESNLIARMATLVSMLIAVFGDRFFWYGFYLVDADKPNELVIGPYQGTLGCLRISFERGVCGACARTGQIQLVDDVHAFEGHIACDSRSNSEIVVPVFDTGKKLAAVLDIDSTEFAAFDAQDAEGLKILCDKVYL